MEKQIIKLGDKDKAEYIEFSIDNTTWNRYISSEVVYEKTR